MTTPVTSPSPAPPARSATPAFPHRLGSDARSRYSDSAPSTGDRTSDEITRRRRDELDDCAFPLLTDIEATSDLNNAFRGTNWALLVGSVPRRPVWSAATS